MAQTLSGALKIAAKKAGMCVADFKDRCIKEKRCTKCKEWRDRTLFNTENGRHDGLSPKCQRCTRVAVRADRSLPRPNRKGVRFSDAAKSRMGRPGGFVSERRGISRTPAERAKISSAVRKVARRGIDAPGFVDGRSVERHGERMTVRAKRWAYDVKLRDHFTCQHCGDRRGGNLHSHHIKPFALFPSLRFEIDNGVTLCDSCHRAEHRRLRKAV